MKHLKLLTVLIAMLCMPVITSCSEDEEETLLNPDNDPYNGHEYVDLGLSVKWATCNVGATTPEEYGDYFAWGETTPKDYYDLDTYKYCNGTWDTMTKYCTSSYYGTVDNKTTLELTDDAAHVNWGGSWRMPTRAEQEELIDTNNCTWEWITQNGVKGYKVTSKKNGNSIFLPVAGLRSSSRLYDAGSNGFYWSSSLDTSDSGIAFHFYFNSSNVSWYDTSRCCGLSVRPVCASCTHKFKRLRLNLVFSC